MERTRLPKIPHLSFYVVVGILLALAFFSADYAMRLDYDNPWDFVRLFVPFTLIIGFGVYLWEQQRKINQYLYRLATTDQLTGAYNYAGLMNILPDLLKSRQDIVLIFIDVNRFKEYNDEKGHLAGNEVLRKLASIVRELLKDGEIFARFGGDEFIIVTTRDRDIEALMNKIAQRFLWATGLTISWGWATPREHETASRLIHRADEQMYLDKKGKKEQDNG